MRGKPTELDLGPISLPLGDGRDEQHDQSQQDQPDREAVDRFEAILGRSRRPDNIAAATQDCPSPFELLGSLDPEHSFDLDQVADAIEHLLAGNGASGVREVRVVLKKDILPDTSVRIYEAAGRLQIEMTVGGDKTKRRLMAALPALATDLGERLKRPLRIGVLNGADDAESGPIEAAIDWPEGCAR